MEESYITYTITVISLLATIATTFIALFQIHHFIASPSDKPSNSKRKTLKQEQQPSANKKKVTKFFRITASISLIFGAFNAFFNSIYCLYFIWDPMHDDTSFYTLHPSHIQRITSTFSWYISKVALVWFFSARLYYAFKGSALSVSSTMLLCVNILNTIAAPLTLTIAYWAVYTRRDHIIKELAFNIWRVLYQIIVLTLLYMFSKRLLLLNVLHRTSEITRDNPRGSNASDTQNIENAYYEPSKISQNRAKFMKLVTRNAVLVLTISLTVALVTLWFFGFRFVFGPQTRLTLLIPMTMAAIDSVITSICVVCMFKVGDKLYAKLCGNCCDSRCSTLCVYISLCLYKDSMDKSANSQSAISQII